ncbi:MAG TPA: hypothetical protein VFC13_02915, partial [Actinomycetes bacterium]|nr:hypothetical protein [Actinomycetes bacterium]
MHATVVDRPGPDLDRPAPPGGAVGPAFSGGSAYAFGGSPTRSSDVSDQHPTVPTWTPEAPPPPPRRRFGPGV